MLFYPDERGQGFVEYAFVMLLVALAVIVILAILGPAIGNIFSMVMNNI
jgi:pilus assembly protein Flp/PilA